MIFIAILSKKKKEKKKKIKNLNKKHCFQKVSSAFLDYIFYVERKSYLYKNM